jgi:FKBP-type peptidyl-prolyl cis-trans isomerase FkpA
MIRTCAPLAAVLTLAACATAPEPTAPLPAPTQPEWEANQAEWLAFNAKQPGWNVTESGLQWRRVGRANPSGAQPRPEDTVKVHYRGVFTGGQEFDSSYSRNEPTEFPLNRVIKGWTEGVGLMREGETFEFLIPGPLAYGDRWVGGEIPPNSALRFTVELLEVKRAD